MTAALPDPDLLRRQAGWLAPARARLLRRVAIARRRQVLDLGAGYGLVTAELVRRSSGPVIALDHSRPALHAGQFAGAGLVCGETFHLPFAAGSFDLVFCQVVLLWVPPVETIAEIWRVLQPGGVLVALEPDYGGMIEHPPTLAARELWLAGLERAGADPYLGRKLPGLLAAQGFAVRVDLLPELKPPSPIRFDLLRPLLTAGEQQQLATIEAAAGASQGSWQQVAHLPFMLVTGTREA